MAAEENKEQTESEWHEWYDQKSRLMEASLGREHDMVLHSMIPYSVGGGLDLYYFPNGIPGTAVATKELCEAPNEGPSNKVLGCYELVMFTRHAIDLDGGEDSPFGKANQNINAILNPMARYAEQAELNANETCEFPEDFEDIAGKCLVFDVYASHTDETVENFGLLAIIEVFRSEMEFAREKGGSVLIELLKQNGHYPYSDLDREPVV
ncbi:suppressor of fused domain protein [Telmatocola sphagniphila]|uniref:Suppressor of fused domain protein n=1 Tax=Telmatocola sphagniphila TaxID=1123043 RepID=A0A8E6EXI6_9BACT|nr:suppressor of fused domain protein [Telmatocola sphagniphila]QVL31301.1 suppressor of fused domain protein [Telmatocola sphagniphila]